MATAFGFGVAALGPAMPSLRDDLGISRTVGGLHFTAIAGGSVLAGLAVGRIIGRWGRRPVFWWGGAGIAAGTLLIGLGGHPAVTLTGGLLIGALGAMMMAVAQATAADAHPFHRAVALTELSTSMSVGTVIPALLIGASLAIGAGWRPGFVVPAAIWAVLLVLRRTEVFPPANRPGARGTRRPLPTAHWFFWPAFIPAVAAEWSVGSWGAGYLVDVAGTTEGSASLLMSVFFGAMVAGRVLGGRAARVVRPFPLLLGTTATGLGGFLLFWGSQSVVPVAGGLLVAGLGISMLFPMLLSLGMATAPDRSDLVSSRVFIAAGGATMVAPVALGAIADQTGIRAAFGVVPGLFVLVAVLAALGYRADRPARA
jgi:predicted MFS family arabinose efflux permease